MDLGCGTGVPTVTLAGADRKVMGIDPASAMLDVARAREGGDSVQWVQGYSPLENSLHDGRRWFHRRRTNTHPMERSPPKTVARLRSSCAPQDSAQRNPRPC
ncbi:class I SAM-dependent methyltransferase [Rothia endophytica]|uniref:class I SAM-dependent methyltransferase n=1 Tax=Rothia endophytica TaxID=1324766 RepID=UPI0031EEDC83